MVTEEKEMPQGSAAPPGEAKKALPKKGGGFPKWAIWLIVVVVILVIAGIAVGVVLALGGGEEEANQAPSIASLTADPDSLAPGEGSEITCVADDPDGDSLSYSWTANGGTISGTGDTITWIAPSLAKGYIIRVTVSDGKGESDDDSVAIIVGIVAPTPTTAPTSTPAPTPTPAPTSAPTPGEGVIDIKSSPAGASVYIDGVDTGSITPYVATHVPAGDHIVLLTLGHYKNRIGVVTVSAGATEYINWAMTYAPTQTLELQPGGIDGKDTFVYEAFPANNYGTSGYLYVSGDGAGEQDRIYIQFDISSIPATSVLLNAYLGLYYDVESAMPAVSGPVGAYRVTSIWAEVTATWNVQPSALATPEKTVIVPASATSAFINWEITDLVEGWFDGSITNYGVMLMDTDEATFEGWKRFCSSETITDVERPKLVIQYYDPTP